REGMAQPRRERPANVLPPGLHLGDDERARAFAAFLSAHRGETHIVALQDYPDPDAISSALAYRALAAQLDIDVDIVYEGHISHQENLALVHLLDIEITRFTDTLPLDRYQGAIYIDNQGTTTRLTDRLAEAGVPPLAIIDHHAPQGVLQPEFEDIRPVGAAATILIDYIRTGQILTLDAERREHVHLATALTHGRRGSGQPESGGIHPVGAAAWILIDSTRTGQIRTLDAERREHVHLATALTHGLRSETTGFIRAGPEEFVAAAFLTPFTDPQL